MKSNPHFQNILLIAAAGRRRDSLVALLSSLVDRDLIHLASDPAEGLRLCNTVRYSFVFLDQIAIQNGLDSVIMSFKQAILNGKLVVLAPTIHPPGFSTSIQPDVVLPDGFSAEDLRAVFA